MDVLKDAEGWSCATNEEFILKWTVGTNISGSNEGTVNFANAPVNGRFGRNMAMLYPPHICLQSFFPAHDLYTQHQQ